MRTIDKIITKANCQYGAPMGRSNIIPQQFSLVLAGKYIVVNDVSKTVFDCRVSMSSCGAYDKGGAYWGTGKELRVSYTKDLTYVKFYR